ncbi:hypothetical protein CYMTET_23749 [Cymbomonas tetramitiformis]|uniref:Uncharacterized protein n=1 Tax=Cymbomonas tetramitiformis TaxID=36881 RepID=A0AAE0FXH3_9CHLO|nr:hypothetical protein CYMTET_23749 [Cymbomonas tetramitiformis]
MVKDVDDNGEEIQVQAHIKCSTAIIYFNIMLQLALGKYGERGTEKSKSFLTCVDRNSTSDSAKWLRGMRKKINQVCFERSIAMGENLDGSPTPIYLCHVRLAVRQYAKVSGMLNGELNDMLGDKLGGMLRGELSGELSGEVGGVRLLKLAKYLIQEHKQMVKDVDDNGEEIQVQAHIKCSTAIIYFNIMLQLALGKYGERGTEKSKSFLTCVDRNSTSDSAKWLRGMRKKINQVCFERSIAMGENLDGSPTPIYLCHVRLAVRQYAKVSGELISEVGGLSIYYPALS